MKLLVAEDDLISRSMLVDILERWGCDVIVTTNGEEALEALHRETGPILAVLDWVMPKMDGLEICRQIGAVRRNRPTYVILLTAMGESDDLVKGLRSGADDYVSKPFQIEELRARITAGERILRLQNALIERIAQLEEAISHIKTLQGLLPICMHCHKIRIDEASWQRIESYIEAHSDAHFSHVLCPECMVKHYPEVGKLGLDDA